jgi:glucose-1-phosphate thymidylyltransferase
MAKQLIPVANKPILYYGLEDMAAAGLTDVAIIIAPQTGNEIRQAVGDGSRFGLSVEYIVQPEPLGLAHALRMALPFADGDDILMYLGDNIVKRGVTDVVSDFEQDRPNCQILLTEVDDPSQFGVAYLSVDGRVERLVEKPSRPRSNLALVGVYLFDKNVEGAVNAIRPSARGELEITDAIQHLIDGGLSVRHTLVTGWWKDTGRKEDLLHANELVLSDITERVGGEIVGGAVRGRLQLGEGSQLVDCSITGPVVIGDNVHMVRTTVGPNTAIGNECRISDARIEASIVLDGSEVSGWGIRNSLLGRGSSLRGGAPPGYAEVTLGERSEVVGE